jgi:hypothetical protein
MECKTELWGNRMYQSFDDFYFQYRNGHFYFQYTNIECKIEPIQGFCEKNLYRIQTSKIPIYRLFETNQENCNLKGSDYYFIPFEDRYETMIWKGYHRKDFSEKIKEYKLKECNFHELFREGGMQCNILIENIFGNNYYFHELEKEVESEIYKVFYSKELNVEEVEEIDDYYQEYMIDTISKMKREMYEYKDEFVCERYVQNMNEIKLMNELLGEYGKMERKYLFKIAEMEYETFIKMEK